MANKWFDITDERLMTFLGALDRAFNKDAIPYMIVGGIAQQVHMAKYLTAVHGRGLLDLATSGDIDLSNCMRSTDNVDVALGLVQDISYTEKINSLKADNKEAIETYGRKRKILSKGKRDAVDNLDMKERERLSQLEAKFRVIDGERKAEGDSRIRSVFDSLADIELDYGGNIVTIKRIRKGYERQIYTLGVNGGQDNDRPLTVNLRREARDVARNGCLGELDPELYSHFLFESRKENVEYTDESNVSLNIMRPEDLLITKILMWRSNDKKDALDLFNYARESGNPIKYDIVKSVLLREREVKYIEDGKEKTFMMKNPVLVERERLFREFVESKPSA